METQIKNEQNNYHLVAKEWKSNLLFVENEIHFIEQLIHSYVFEPNTPTLFERLEHFKTQILDIKEKHKKIRQRVVNHDNELGGLMESHDIISLNTSFDKKQQMVSADYTQFITVYKTLKSEIFEYCGGILKHNKK
ncbi:hypothetical protein [uncultured Dokdonia sp.]|uniref:hypothetical protein n=1 Tax=uncultured Dokdonia sp. TaxID=575653 RepID=UPI0026290A31|nr:hypothetical protein [uncultured Dokdonia sp.]